MGFRYPPVASITAVLTSWPASHSASAATPVDKNDCLIVCTSPPAATRTQPTTVSRCTSKPATRSRPCPSASSSLR